MFLNFRSNEIGIIIVNYVYNKNYCQYDFDFYLFLCYHRPQSQESEDIIRLFADRNIVALFENSRRLSDYIVHASEDTIIKYTRIPYSKTGGT